MPPPPPNSCLHVHMQGVMQPLLRVMAELKKQEGPLERLEIGSKLGEGGFGVEYKGEKGRGSGRRGEGGEAGPCAGEGRVGMRGRV